MFVSFTFYKCNVFSIEQTMDNNAMDDNNRPDRTIRRNKLRYKSDNTMTK